MPTSTDNCIADQPHVYVCLRLQLSMDVVEVHPDGSLRVEALAAHRHPHTNRFTTKVNMHSEHWVRQVPEQLPGLAGRTPIASPPRLLGCQQQAVSVRQQSSCLTCLHWAGHAVGTPSPCSCLLGGATGRRSMCWS